MHSKLLNKGSQDNQLKEEATKIYEKMFKKTFEVPAKVGENGKIFGSITNIQLADSLGKAGFKEKKILSMKYKICW